MEHEEQADRMEEEAERMEHHSEQLGERIEGVQEDWDQKEHDPSVPGAQPEQSDQLPEEAPGEAVHEDDADEHGTDGPGVPGEEEETGTGNPDAAGSDE
jgi:hypothetical protein